MGSVIIVGHTVRDFASWKLAFDHQESSRRDLGFISHSMHRDVSKHGRIIVTLRTDHMHHARSLAQDRDALRHALALTDGADVDIWFGEGIEDRGYAEEILTVDQARTA